MQEIFAEETFQADGKEYTLKPLGLEDRGRFCVYVEAQQIALYKRHRADLGDDYGTAIKSLKPVRWRSQEWIDALETVEGTQEMAYLMLHRQHADMTREQVAAFWDDPELSRDIAEKIARLINRPNSPRPQETGGR